MAKNNNRRSSNGRSSNGRPRESLTIDDFSDLALLHLVDECVQTEGDDNGWASSRDIAELLNLETTAPAANVGIRLAFLAKEDVAIVEHHPHKAVLWRLTDAGIDLLDASLTAAQQRALEGLAESRAVAVTAILGEQLGRLDAGERKLVRREFRYNFSRFRSKA